MSDDRATKPAPDSVPELAAGKAASGVERIQRAPLRGSNPRVEHRPTVEPPFDPVTYARESERKMRVFDVASEPALAVPRAPSFHDVDAEPPTRPRPSSGSIDVRGSEQRVAHASRPMLEAGPDLIPFLTASREDIEWFDLEDDARTILSAVDGTSTLGAVLAKIDVPDAITILSELGRLGIVQFRR